MMQDGLVQVAAVENPTVVLRLVDGTTLHLHIVVTEVHCTHAAAGGPPEYRVRWEGLVRQPAQGVQES